MENLELNKKPIGPIIDVDGYIENGKEFDIDVKLPEDNRNVIFGIVKNCFNEPIENAVVKLVEIKNEFDKKERLPVTHTFTDKHGEFVFGPLCSGIEYALEIFVNDVKHVKMIVKGKNRNNKCLRTIPKKCDLELNTK